MVALRVVVVTLALFALSVDCASVTFNDMTSPDSTLANIAVNWKQSGACWTQGGAGGAQFATGTAGCQGLNLGNAALQYGTAVNSVSSGTPGTQGYVCAKIGFSAALAADDIISIGDTTTQASFTLPKTTTSGTSVYGTSYTLNTNTITPLISINSPAGNAAITTTVYEYRHIALLTQYKGFTNSPTFVAGGTKSSVGGFQFNGGQTPVSDTITGPGQAVTGSFTGSTTTTPITYGFAPNANWVAASDGQTYSLTLTDSAVYKPPASAGATCTAGAQTLSTTVVVNVVMVTAITSPATPNNADLFGSDSVLVEKFGGTGSYAVTATGSTDTTKCSWTDTTPATKTATGATFTTNTVSANGGTLTVTCPGTGAGSGVTFTTTSYPIKIVQVGTISVTGGGGYASAGNKLVTGTGSNPTISIIKSLDTTQITFTTTSAKGSFGTNPATGGGPFTTTVSGLVPKDDGQTITATAQYKGTAVSAVTDAVTLNIIYVSISTFTDTTTNSQQTTNCPAGYTSPCIVASTTTPAVTFSTVGTGFDTQGILINGALTAGGVGGAGGSTQSITFTVGQDKATVASRVANSAAPTFLIDSNGSGSTATNQQYTLAFLSVTAGTNGLKSTSTNSNAAGDACVMSPAMTSNTCTFQVGGTAFNTVDVVETGGTGLGKTGISVAPGGTITSNTGAAADDGATVVIKASISGVAGYVETSAQSISIYYLSVSTFETNTAPAAFKNGGNYYVVLNSATPLKLQTIGTGFNTVSYSANLGTLKTTPQSSNAGTATAWLAGSSPNRVATQPQLTITGLGAADNTAIVSTTISNPAVSASVTYTPSNALNIVYLFQSAFSVTAAPATVGKTCYATPASTCTFTLTGTGFDTFDYTSSATGTKAAATNQAATIAGSPPVSTATWTPALDYRDTTSNAAMPVTMTYTAYYTAQPATRLTITASLPLIFVSDIDNTNGLKYTPVTNSQAAPNTLNLFAAGDNTATSPNPKISGKGTGFTDAKVQRKNAGGMFVDVGATYTACTVSNPGTSTATYDCPLIPTVQTGFLPADDQAQFQVVLWNSGNTGVTYTTSAITVTVFGFKTDPPVSLVGFTTVRTPPYNPPTTNFVSYTYALVNANSVPTAPGNNVPQTQTWSTFAGDAARDPVMPATTTALTANSIITFLVSANAALSSTPNAPWTAGGTFVGKNGDSYKITLTLSGVSTFRQTSFQLVTFSYFLGTTQPNANGDYLYDYYSTYTSGPKAPYVPPNPEPAYSINVRADHLAPLDKTGTIKAMYSNACTLTVTPGTAGLVGPTLSKGPQTNVDAIEFLVDCTQSTDPSQPNCVYNQVEKLNGATLQVACGGDAVYTSTTPSPYGASVPLVIKYPAKMGLLPTNTWTSTPAEFCSGYTGQYPEPGHWDYDQPLTINFNWAKLGNPPVTAIQQVMTWDIRTVSSSGTPLAIASSGGFPGAPTVLNGANPIPYQISNGGVALTIAQARDIYFNNYLTVTAKFTGTGGTPLLTPFTITFQPLDVSIDNGILQPHFPPVLATTPALLAPQFNNFADVGGFVWQPPPLGFIVKHGFPKHDSPFGNINYIKVSGLTAFPNRNYDQILETRVTVAFGQPTPTSPTTYDNKYQYFTSVNADLTNAGGTKSFTEPKAGVVSNAYTNGIPGVYAVTSTITPTGPLWTYNKWIYRWILGVYKVSGKYEPYVVPTVNVFDPAALTYKYHTASSGFEGVWNWYPREFTPSSCPSVPTGNPFDIGTTDAVVVPSTTASMYPSPDAGVLSWAYSHQTAGPSFRIDSTLASGILSGAQNSNTALLPSVSTVVHTFNSQYTVVIQQASATTDAFGPQTTENLGYTVTATGKISSIVSADANSIITARYSHTLPFYLLLAPDGNPTTSGQRTLVGYPTVVTVNNCKVITTLANNTPFTVNSHRAGETFVLSLSSVTAGGTFSVTIVDATPGTMDTAQTVISQTVTAGTSPVFRFTAGYNLAGSALTKSTIKYSGITGTVKLSYHEFSSIPANWPFANDPTGAVIGAYTNNEAVKTCVGQKVSASSVSGTTAPGFGIPKTPQYFGCGTTDQVTSPTC